VVFSFKNLTKLSDTARRNLRNYSGEQEPEDEHGINCAKKEKLIRNDLIRQGLSQQTNISQKV